jgi:hypothetical protein
MKRWRCPHCWKPEVPEAEWEDYLTQSFCRMCGAKGERVYEFGCFTCDDTGVIFWADDEPSHPCPDCNSPAYRIVHAPYVSTPGKRADYEAADKMLERELTNQNRSLTTFERHTKPVDERLEVAREQNRTQADPRLQGGWVAPNQVIGRAMPGSQVNPLGTMPRPTTIIAGSFDKSD